MSNRDGTLAIPAGRVLLIIAIITLAGSLANPRTAWAQKTLPRYIDCGDLNGFTAGEPGYELFTETLPPAGMFFSPAPLDTVHVAGNFPNYYGFLPKRSDILSVDPDQLDQTHRLTALQLADFTVREINNLENNALYRVRLELGALTPWGEPVDPINFEYYSTVSRQVRVEIQDPNSRTLQWRTSASNIRCTSSYNPTTYQTIVSGIIPLWVLAQSDSSGALRMRFSTDGSDPLFIAGFELHSHEDLSIVYRHTGNYALQGFTPGVMDFVDAFNSGDFPTAEALALIMTDDFECGTALTHLIGWLDGTQDEYFYLVDEAQSALQSASASHPAAAWLLDELSSFQRALDHLDAGGNTWAQKCPEEGGYGFLNESCKDQVSVVSGGFDLVNANTHIAIRELRGITAAINGDTVLEDLLDWNAGSLPTGTWEPSPLGFAALKIIGTRMVCMNPNLNYSAGDPESLELRQDRLDIFDQFIDLGFAGNDFPSDYELILFEAYMDIDQPPAKWDIGYVESILTPAQIEDSWWGPQVALLPEDTAAPGWANSLRNQENISRNIAGYWFSKRLKKNELGGGWGDDVELFPQFASMLAGRQDQMDRRMMDAMDNMVHYGFYEFEGIRDGYFAASMTDVEHSGEYTSYPYIAHVNLFGHTATTADVALDVARHLLYSSEPAKSWTGVTDKNRRHFKSFMFNADGPSSEPEAAIDILLNGRATIPGVYTAAHAPLAELHPLIQDLTSWASAWRDDADDTGGGKPAGWHGPVIWPENDFGTNGHWWTFTGNPADTSLFTTAEYGYTLGLLHMAYNNSTGVDRWKYLLPAVRMFRAVKEWEDDGMPSHPQGSNYWAAELFKSGWAFGSFVIFYYDELQKDPDLNTRIDPLGSGYTYVDAQLLERMEGWVEEESNGQHPIVKYALGDIVECSGGETAKRTALIDEHYQEMVTFYRAIYPLITKHVVHTDRVPLNYLGGGPNDLLVSTTGEEMELGLTFQPLVRWRSRLDDGQDIAILCNYRDYASTIYSAFVYNFESTALDITVQLDAGLVPGRYLVEWGDATQDCDMFPSGAIIYSSEIQKRGRGISTSVVLQPGLNLVCVSRLDDADQEPAGYDLVLDPPVVDIPSGFMRLKARVANMGQQASPPATMNFYISTMYPDGSIHPVGGPGDEVFIGEKPVRSLAATVGWTMDEAKIVLLIPLDESIITTLLSGSGYQVRVQVVADGLEGDLLNNDQTRGWLLSDMEIVEHSLLLQRNKNLAQKKK